MDIGFMMMHHLMQFILLIAVTVLVASFFGSYMEKVYSRKNTILLTILSPLENLIYKICGLSRKDGKLKQMSWKGYALCLLSFSLFGFLLLFLMLYFQNVWTGHKGLSADLAFNIAVSFVTNTNWQSYSPEQTLSDFTQMFGMTVQNFVSSATGLCVLLVVIRGFIQKNTSDVGNFWEDLTKSVLYILLPLSVIGSVILLSLGGVQGLSEVQVPLLEGGTQNIPTGFVASQIAIKQIGVNGAGFFNANAAHPFENPNALSNFIQMVMMLLLPVSAIFMYGRMVNNMRQAYVILGAMTVIFIPLFFLALSFEVDGNANFLSLGIDQIASTMQAGGNFEGKETRFGTFLSVLWGAITTATSCGAVNAMHDSFTSMAGFVTMLFMKFSEVIYGGVGCGLYGMLVFVLLTVFIAGLMVGRTPEYLGKKISVFEIKMVSLIVLLPSLMILLVSALCVMTTSGTSSILNHGPHGLSEILYAVTSATNNNGSAFAGLNANTDFYNIILGICMIVGRFGIIIPILAMAGSLSEKNIVPSSAGTLQTDTTLFMFILVGIIILIGVLTFIPALALGPVAEYLS